VKLQRKAKSAVGLDLGHFQIKAVEIDPIASGWRIVRTATVPTPPDSIKEGVVVDVQAMTQAIKQVMKEGRFSTNRVHIAAAGGSVFVRPVQFPKMNEATLRKTIKFEASRYVPGSVEDSLVDFTILDPGTDEVMNVMVVAAPKDIINSRLAAAKGAGLEVEAVDVEAFATYRALVETLPVGEASQSMAIIDIGAGSTSVSVVHNGAFAMNRSIPYGGQTFTEALKSYFKLSSEDAEEGKSQLDLRELISTEGPRENPPLRVIQSHLDDLVREVRRSLNYFQSQTAEGQGARKVESLVVSGGGGKLPGLDAYLAHKLGLPVTLMGMYDHPDVAKSEGLEEHGLELVVAGGLAMRPYMKAA
jgi:type IV pilus assembly protein PilM